MIQSFFAFDSDLYPLVMCLGKRLFSFFNFDFFLTIGIIMKSEFIFVLIQIRKQIRKFACFIKVF